MSTATPGTYRQKHLDSSRATFKGRIDFDSKPRQLELVIAQAMPDEDADVFENLVLPLTVLVAEEMDSDENPEAREGYEDVYSFTPDGDFMGHSYRAFKRRPGETRNYNSKQFMHDGDISKLFRYGKEIRDIMRNRQLGPILDNHPTVQRLKNHELWKYPPNQQAQSTQPA